jgi:hypothetical protein
VQPPSIQIPDAQAVAPEGSPEATAQATRTERFAAAGYRVWQLWRSVLPHQVGQVDRAVLDAILPAGGASRLFAAMSANDQHHSLMVYRALRDRGCADTEMLTAALLHDSGKGSGHVPLWVRPIVVLTHALLPGVLSWLAQNEHSRWRRPFYNAWHHADIGAELAAAAGLSPRTVLLIRTHHQPDGPAALLHAVDDGL